MSELKLTGVVIEVGNYQQGKSAANKDWEKQTFTIQHGDGNYKNFASFTLFGEKVKLCPQQGETVEVHFNINSRPYGDKWYTDLQAWKINSLDKHAAAEVPQDELTPDNDLPF